MAADPDAATGRRRRRRKRRVYWQKRKGLIYLFAARQICTTLCGQPKSVIDVGSNGTPTLEWHRATAARLVSLDLRRPYIAEGVESLTCDFLEYEPETSFDLVTCFQVLEHVPDPVAFARKLLQMGEIAVVSVPYKWKKGRCRYHLHDPVNERKMRKWFGRDPDFSYIATELNTVNRLIHVYKQQVSFSTPA
jgi:hypothetical protein